MNSMLNTNATPNSKQADDPHDVVVVAPDAVRVSPADEELSNLLRDAARQLSGPLTQTGSDAGAPVPPVDTTFRPAVVNDMLGPGHRWSMARPAVRAFVALFLAAGIGLAAVAWQSHGDAARAMIAKWTTQLVPTSSPPLEKSGLPAQPAAPAVEAAAADAAPSQPAAPAVAADAANAAPPQPAPPAQTAAERVAPAAAAAPPDQAQSLQSMARDLASLGQEVQQLKAGMEQLKASQQQMSRDVAKASEQNKVSEQNKATEQNPRPRTSAPPPRSAAAPARRPTPPRQAAAVPPPPPAAPYMPRRAEPQAMPPPPDDPELATVPRPPMPVR